MTTLITGAAGFIGSHLLRQLSQKEEHVRIIVRKGTNTRNIDELKNKNIERFYCDLLDPACIRRALKGCDRVYHLAGLVSTLRSMRKGIWESNYTATVNLFNCCMDSKLDKIVYLASIFALGRGTRDMPADENTTYNLGHMRIPYFQAKRAAETESYTFLRKGLPIVYVYPTFCLGPNDIYLSSSSYIVNFLKRKIPVYINGGVNIIDVRDAAKGLILGMDKCKVGERYIVGDHDITFKGLFQSLSDLTDIPTPRVTAPVVLAKAAGWIAETILKDPPIDYRSAMIAGEYWYYDSSRAKKELGLKGRPLEETLRDAINWFRENGYA